MSKMTFDFRALTAVLVSVAMTCFGGCATTRHRDSANHFDLSSRKTFLRPITADDYPPPLESISKLETNANSNTNFAYPTTQSELLESKVQQASHVHLIEGQDEDSSIESADFKLPRETRFVEPEILETSRRQTTADNLLPIDLRIIVGVVWKYFLAHSKKNTVSFLPV